MLINYKKIGDTLTDSELNAYASLIAHNKVLKDSFKLKNGKIIGEYGEYTFDLTNASIVDNGILITDETLSNNITVKLSNATQYATYTLHFTVIRYGDVNILDEPTENIESFDLSVDLITDTTVNIPLDTLQEYDVILFNSNITIKHDKPEIIGKYITDLQLTADKPIIQTSETSTLEITATDLEHLPMPNKSIQLLKNNVLLDTLTTDSQGKCSYNYVGQGVGKQNFVAKYRGLQSETYSITDCMFYDDCVTTPEEENKWIASNIVATRSSNGLTLAYDGFGTYYANKKGTSTGAYDWGGTFAVEFDVVAVAGGCDVQLHDGTNNASRSFTTLSATSNNHVKILNDGSSVKYFVDGVEKTSLQYNYSMGTCRVGFRTQLSGDTMTIKNFMIYPV